MAKQSSVSYWSDAWLDAIASFSHPGRMRRGRRFAEQGRFKRFEVTPGHVSARVKDGSNTYHIDLEFEPLDDDTWAKIIRHLASQALFSARLLDGEIPAEVIDVFHNLNAPLFPAADSLQATCTCPDWEVPCKHIAALYYRLADQFDDDPFLLFLLRGRSRSELLSALRQERQVALPSEIDDFGDEAFLSPPLAESIANFYAIGPSIEDVHYSIRYPDTSFPHLRRLGPPPFTSLDLIASLSPIYEEVSETALRWAYQASDKNYD